MAVNIPLTNDASQSMIILGFTLLIKWNVRDNAWRMDVVQNAVPLIAGLKLTSGVSLLRPYALGIGDFLVYQNAITLVDPTRDGFSTGQFILVYLTQQEVDDAISTTS